MPSVRLLADDLTGALDTAAELVGVAGPIPVRWSAPDGGAWPSSWAFDTGTREAGREEALAIVGDLAAGLARADIAYKKVDSLLRGNSLPEIAACFRRGGWTRCILAPAFPAQGRRTRSARQLARRADGEWHPASGDMVEALLREGVPAHHGRTDRDLPDGIGVFDAEDDGDLRGIAALGRRSSEPVLWCGSGGLAAALAEGRTVPRNAALTAPVLGLFGSDQAETAFQLAACSRVRMLVPRDGDPADCARRLARDGVLLVGPALPGEVGRREAAERIAALLGSVAEAVPRPGTLLASGGETLRGICAAIGAARLDVTGQVAPGLPRSVVAGGRWDGVEVVSKSGSFGTETVWRDLLRANGFRS